MAKFREFYVQAGAGSNFLASKCLWADKVNDLEHPRSGLEITPDGVNEYLCARERTLADQIKLERGNGWEADEILRESTKEIMPILKSIDEFLSKQSTEDYPYNDVCTIYNREHIINERMDQLWREDSSLFTHGFFHPFKDTYPLIPEEIKNQITQIEDYFAECREYYYKICEDNNWNVRLITHNHPFIGVSPRLNLPENFKSLHMELDAEMDIMMRGLLDIKVHKIHVRKNNTSAEYYHKNEGPIEDLFVNRGVVFSDEKVSYRKIFFENDRLEIMKMYEFFDNKAYFQQNKVQIMKEFKDYHDSNMAVIQKFIPHLYKQLIT